MFNEIDCQAWLKQSLTARLSAYAYALLGVLYFKLCSNRQAKNLASAGWQFVAVKKL